MQLTRNRQDAEDLVQEATLRAYRYFHRFERGTNFKAWIMTILRNLYINKYRKKLKEPVKIEFEEVENFISLPEISGVHEEIFSEMIRNSVDKLPQELRMVITLFYVDGFTYKEVAKITEVPLGTVMSRLYTARQILKCPLCALTLENEKKIDLIIRQSIPRIEAPFVLKETILNKLEESIRLRFLPRIIFQPKSVLVSILIMLLLVISSVPIIIKKHAVFPVFSERSE